MRRVRVKIVFDPKLLKFVRDPFPSSSLILYLILQLKTPKAYFKRL